MTLTKLIQDIKDELFVEACDWQDDTNIIYINHKTPGGGVIEVNYTMQGHDKDQCEVLVYGSKAENHENLEEYLTDQLTCTLDWDAVEDYLREVNMDEWQAHGFRDAADYWRWKGF